MTTEPQTYDVVILGAGAVAENVADRAVQGGLTALLIESELVGGECSYWACMPSKALIRSGMALRAAQRLQGAKQAVTGDLDVAAVFARRTVFTHDWDDASQVTWVDGAGISLLRGHARLTGEKRVSVTAADGSVTDVIATHAVVISTGSDPLLPDIPGLVEANPWTPRDATSATSAPDSLAIIGGGVVGENAIQMAVGLDADPAGLREIANLAVRHGASPVLAALVADRGEPYVARLRALGRITSIFER